MKVLSGVLTALVVVVAGLAGGSPAVAGGTPYPHSIATVCKSVPKPGVITVKARPKVRFKIRVAGTTLVPRTKVAVRAVKKPKSTHTVAWEVTRRYRGRAVVWSLPKLPQGTYSLRFRTKFRAASVFKDCRSRATIKVTR
jgi:hypothetical protein